MSSNPDTQPTDALSAGALRHLKAHLPPEQVVLARLQTTPNRIADAITAFAGSMRFVVIHVAWFGGWIAVNLGALGKARIFDPYPFGLLTMIVSLEAIFLSTFVMISQNRQGLRENVRADLDFENNVRSEVWSMHIGKQLGIDPESVERQVQELLGQSRDAMAGTATGRPSDS